MRKLNILLALLIIANISNGQKISLNQFKNLKPRSIGPAGMSGRVTAIDALHSNPDIIYLGTASGGVWKTENGGSNWQPIFDDQPNLNIGAVALQQSNPSVLWVGTGEGNPRNSLNLGCGIYKSEDAGKSWKGMGLEKTKNIHRVIIDPTDPNTLYVASIGNPYSEHPERGVYKTTDGGESWKLILHTNDTSGCAELVMDPTNPNKLIANMWQHRRTPFSFTSGGPGSGLYVTYDGGKTWKKLGKKEGLPDGDYGRIGITISSNQPKRIYAMVEATKNGLYKTDDGGFNWTLVNSNPADVTNRPFYFQDIKVDPQNENRLYNIYQMISVSEDGGKTFTNVIPYYGIHPDHHAFWIHPTNPNFIIDGNDGGIGISRDRGRTWKFDEQLPVGQFYHINVDNEIPYHVMGGMQDNGSWRGPAYTWMDGSIKNYFWDNLMGGDGFDVAADPQDANWVYAMSQKGNLGRYNTATGEKSSLKPPVTDLKIKLRFNWNAAFAQSPQEESTIYYGSQFVHKSTNKGLSWQIISPDLTTNNPDQQKQDENGGLSLDITGAENFNTILCIEPSPKDKNVIWAGTDDGNVQLTKDGGKTWFNFRGKIPGMPLGAWIPQIRASRYSAGEAFVICNDYRRGDFKPYIFRTKNYGQTWETMLHEKKASGYALCMIQDPVEPNLIFAGTEQGLWISFDNGTSFEQWKNGYPSVSTYDLAIQEREADLCIGTFGRALYIMDDIRPLRKVAANNGNVLKKKLTVFEAPIAYQVEFKRKAGYDYSTWGLFDGENRSRGASYSFYINPGGKQGNQDNFKKDSVLVKIYNEENNLIRTMKINTDSGFNRGFWQFDMKGVRQPGAEKLKPNAPEPTGSLKVFPGRYKLIVWLGKEADSTIVIVKPDPAVKVSRQTYDAKMAAVKRIEKSTAKVVEISDRLTEGEETIAKVDAQLKNVEGMEADSLRKTGKAMADSILKIRNFILGTTPIKQGYVSSTEINVKNMLKEAIDEVTGKDKIPDAQEFRLIEIAEELVRESIQKTNLFFNGIWKEYQQQAGATPIKLFNDFIPIQ